MMGLEKELKEAAQSLERREAGPFVSPTAIGDMHAVPKAACASQSLLM